MRWLLVIKYTSEMHEVAAEMGVTAQDLFPQFSGGRRKFLVNTVIDLNLEERDMTRILLFDELGNMHQIRVKPIPSRTLSSQYKRMINKLALIIIAKNNEILKKEKDPKGFYILWAADSYFEIRYFLKEEISLHGRIYHIQGKGQLKIATNNINETGLLANSLVALLVFGLIVFFLIAVVSKIGGVLWKIYY